MRSKFVTATILLISILLTGSCSRNLTPTGTKPLPRAHAHNDYEHDRPLFDALDHGFTSVEADVHLVDGELFVAHNSDEIKPHLLEDLDPLFSKNVSRGDIILAGKNFGCGSSREQPVVGLKAVGIDAVVAESFARIFYRAAINQGLILIECPDAMKAYSDGDNIILDIDNGKIEVGGKEFSFPKLPKEIMAIREAGGLLGYTRSKLREKNR